MDRISVHDLKYGSGAPLRPGDSVELHYEVAASLELLDTAEVIQSSWKRGRRPLTVTLGEGTLRADIEDALYNVPVGSDRRLEIPGGTWPDVAERVAISLSIVAIVPRMEPGLSDEAGFEQIACALPPLQRDAADQLARALLFELTEAVRKKGRPRQGVCRVKLNDRLYEFLQKVIERQLDDPLQYGIRYVGKLADGSHEIEISIADIGKLEKNFKRDALREPIQPGGQPYRRLHRRGQCACGLPHVRPADLVTAL